MATIPHSLHKRLSKGVKKYKALLSDARKQDKDEANTVRLVTGMLCEIFGYDQYSDISAEHEIHGTYCDLAVKTEGGLIFLIETKAIGLDLKDHHVDQAVTYAIKQGIDWAILTNGLIWRIYRVKFNKPIDKDLIFEIDFETVDLKSGSPHTNLVFMLTKEGWKKSVLKNFYSQKKALDRFLIAALIRSPIVVKIIRRELKKHSPKIKLKPDQIQNVIENEVLKLELVEGQKADDARKHVRQMLGSEAKNHNEKPKDFSSSSI